MSLRVGLNVGGIVAKNSETIETIEQLLTASGGRAVLQNSSELAGDDGSAFIVTDDVMVMRLGRERLDATARPKQLEQTSIAAQPPDQPQTEQILPDKCVYAAEGNEVRGGKGSA